MHLLLSAMVFLKMQSEDLWFHCKAKSRVLLSQKVWVWGQETWFLLHEYVCTLCMPGVHGNRRVLDAHLELGLQMVMNCLIWMLGTEYKSSGRAVSAHKL